MGTLIFELKRKTSHLKLSIIIPALNEATSLSQLLPDLIDMAIEPDKMEIIIVDGGSEDQTQAMAKQYPVCVINQDHPCRAEQMNTGAKAASGDVLYFLHADVQPPHAFDEAILNSVFKSYPAGSFRLQFDLDHWFLNICAWFSRFRFTPFRFGDQSLFVKQEHFWLAGGFRVNHYVMEDQAMVRDLKQIGTFTVIDQYVTASARKFRENGVYRQQWRYLKIYLLYYMGLSQEQLRRKLLEA